MTRTASSSACGGPAAARRSPSRGTRSSSTGSSARRACRSSTTPASRLCTPALASSCSPPSSPTSLTPRRDPNPFPPPSPPRCPSHVLCRPLSLFPFCRVAAPHADVLAWCCIQSGPHSPHRPPSPPPSPVANAPWMRQTLRWQGTARLTRMRAAYLDPVPPPDRHPRPTPHRPRATPPRPAAPALVHGMASRGWRELGVVMRLACRVPPAGNQTATQQLPHHFGPAHVCQTRR